MKRHEVAAIIGAYSRQGFSASAAEGGFILSSGSYSANGYTGEISFRSTREARLDTGIDLTRSIITRQGASYRAQLHAEG